MDCFEAALAVADAHCDLLGKAHALNGKGIVEQLRGNLEAAASHYAWSLNRATRAGDAALPAMIHQNLGVIANIQGDFAEALMQYRSCKEAYDDLGEDDRVGPLLNNIGRLHTDREEWAEAEAALEESSRRCAESGDVDHHVHAQVNLARLWIARGDLERARTCCDIACNVSRDVAEGRWSGEILTHYGTIYRLTGRPDLALDSLRQARDVAGDQKDTLLAAEIAREFAEVYADQGRNQDTLKVLNECLRLFSEFQAKHDLAEVRDRIARLEYRFLDVVCSWGESIESKDRYTQGHCERVAHLACSLAAAAGLDQKILTWFRMGALLHDLGKIAVPSSILNKPGRLTTEEWGIMKKHPEAGVELLKGIEFPWDIRPMVRHHHERWNGTGYPHGLAGEDIPLSARILCLADVFDALTTDRSYRSGLPADQALAVMRDEAGSTFDPLLFRVFESLSPAERVSTPESLSTGARRRWVGRSPVDRRRNPVSTPHLIPVVGALSSPIPRRTLPPQELWA
jgi:putative nucleotidyltransferase with HDIG domain